MIHDVKGHQRKADVDREDYWPDVSVLPELPEMTPSFSVGVCSSLFLLHVSFFICLFLPCTHSSQDLYDVSKVFPDGKVRRLDLLREQYQVEREKRKQAKEVALRMERKEREERREEEEERRRGRKRTRSRSRSRSSSSSESSPSPSSFPSSGLAEEPLKKRKKRGSAGSEEGNMQKNRGKSKEKEKKILSKVKSEPAREETSALHPPLPPVSEQPLLQTPSQVLLTAQDRFRRRPAEQSDQPQGQDEDAKKGKKRRWSAAEIAEEVLLLSSFCFTSSFLSL